MDETGELHLHYTPPYVKYKPALEQAVTVIDIQLGIYSYLMN